MTASLFSVAREIQQQPVIQELEFEWELKSGLPAEPERPSHLRLVSDPQDVVENADLPDPGEWSAILATSLLEALSGDRPVSQLTRWLAKDIHAELTAQVAAVKRHPSGRIRSVARRTVSGVRVCFVKPGVVETCAVVVGNTRARSVAIRLEAVKGRWLATAVQLV